MKLDKKIAFSFLTVTAIVMSVLMSVFYTAAKSHLKKSISAHLATTVHSRSHHVETFLEMGKESVKQLSKSIVIERFLSAGREGKDYNQKLSDTIRRLEDTVKIKKYIYSIFVLNKNGTIVASSETKDIGEDKSDDLYFLEGKKGPYIKDAYHSKTVGRGALAFSVPVKADKKGKFLGVIVARIKMDMLNEITAERIGLGKTGEICLVNRNGYMITPSRFAKDTFLKQKVDTENVRACFEHREKGSNCSWHRETKIFLDYRGVNVLGAHHYIPQMQWALLAEIDQKEALAPLVKLKVFSIIALCSALTIVLLISILISRAITKPIHLLHRGTEIIGEGNLDHKVGTDTKDEIGQLSRAFDKMTDDLKKTTTSIDNLNREIAYREQVV